jgi:hypothetical protein
MTDGYLSKDRDHLNRMQRERRARLVRIDYHPDADALALIEAKRPRYGPEATNSATLNAIVREWAEATGIKCREVERPKTSGGMASCGDCGPVARARTTPGASGNLKFLDTTRASDSGASPGISAHIAPVRARELGPQQRVPCGATRRRDGKPCQALSVPGKHRCKWHGGASTGPKTPEGRARSHANLRRGKSEAGEPD